MSGVMLTLHGGNGPSDVCDDFADDYGGGLADDLAVLHNIGDLATTYPSINKSGGDLAW